jgi:superfamily II DNA or RNA helicase
VSDIRLRPYQTTSATDIRGAFLQGIRSVLLVSPTASGKTVTFSYIAKGAAARDNPTLILAHRDFLIKQASQKLSAYGVRHGIIMADYMPSPDAMVQVGSVQTMQRRLRKNKYHFKLIIVDEAHLSCARTYLEIIDAFPEARILGVTGSPCRLDGRGLGTGAGGRFDHMIESVTMRELIDDAYAVQPIVYGPLHMLDFSKIPKDKGDFEKNALSEFMRKGKMPKSDRTITGSAIDHYLEYAKHVPAATWCVDLAHASQTAKEFNEAGIKTAFLQGTDDPDTRDRALRMLADGSISNITFCQLLVEGVDVPELGCIVGLRPTHSLAAYLQTLGRMSRPLYAKGFDLDTRESRFAAMDAGPKGRNSIYLDHAGLTFRHGFQDDIREWSLLGVPKTAKEGESVIAIRQCPVCLIVFPPVPACPGCGHVFETQTRKLEMIDGKLGKITPEMLGAVKRNKQHEVRKAETREDFERIAKERNYSPAWVTIQLRIKRAKDARKAEAEKKAVVAAAADPAQTDLWLEQEVQTLRTHPKYNLDKDWSDL